MIFYHSYFRLPTPHPTGHNYLEKEELVKEAHCLEVRNKLAILKGMISSNKKF